MLLIQSGTPAYLWVRCLMLTIVLVYLLVRCYRGPKCHSFSFPMRCPELACVSGNLEFYKLKGNIWGDWKRRVHKLINLVSRWNIQPVTAWKRIMKFYCKLGNIKENQNRVYTGRIDESKSSAGKRHALMSKTQNVAEEYMWQWVWKQPHRMRKL